MKRRHLVLFLLGAGLLPVFLIFQTPANANESHPDCNPTFINPGLPQSNVGANFDTGEWETCFEIQKIKFAVPKITLTDKNVLTQVDISGVAYFDETNSCLKRNKDERLCRIDRIAIGLAKYDAPYLKGQVLAGNAKECADAKFNYLPSNANNYLKIGNPKVIDTFLPTSNVGRFILSFPLLIPTNCLSGEYRVNVSWSGWGFLYHNALIGVDGNKFTIISVQKSQSPSPTSQTKVEGTSCSKPGQTKTINGTTYACLITGKSSKWLFLGQPTTKQAPSSKSEADKLVASGCRAFPSAIVRLQNASGSTYNSALIAAQEAAISIAQASRLEGKYGVLNNAQYIIVQYAQAVGWGGRGYSGDINTVRTALATFNASCNSNLTLK
jgi:hypothetical protein